LRVENYFKSFCRRLQLYPVYSRIFNKLSTLNSQLSILIFISAFSISHALDPIYDYRYTLGPEILVPDAFHVGAGAFSRFNEDAKIVFNLQVGIIDNLEAGLKYMVGTNDDWIITRDTYRNHTISMIDIGIKFALSKNLSLQADVPMAINRDREWGGVLSLSQWDGYTRNVSFLFEGRLGFGGAAGDGRYVKPVAAFFPYFQIGESFRLSTGTIVSGSNYFKDDFMLDILPKLEVGLVWFRAQVEYSIGILTWKAEKHNRLALFITSDI